MHIAVLLTCFNRKDKTIASLKHLETALLNSSDNIKTSIYLTDDGSTDGTGDAVREKFPNTTVLNGNGSLFWAGGMRNSWSEALKEKYDFYLLLNDDTNVFPNLFDDLIFTDNFCKTNYNQRGIYIGSTLNKDTRKISYGGFVFINRFLGTAKKLIPNGKTPQECELGNANIKFVHSSVVDKIGILHKSYVHGLADFDYTLMAKKNGIPVLIMPNFLGECEDDHTNPYHTFHQLTIKKRIALLNSPLGLDFKSNLQYMKRNFPLRYPLIYMAYWFKILFPKTYAKRFR